MHYRFEGRKVDAAYAKVFLIELGQFGVVCHYAQPVFGRWSHLSYTCWYPQPCTNHMLLNYKYFSHRWFRIRRMEWRD